MRQWTLRDDSLLSCPLWCLPSPCFTLQCKHPLAFYLPTSCCPCLSCSTVQTFRLTAAPHTPSCHTHQHACLPPGFPIASRSVTTQCFQMQAPQPHLAGTAGQGKAGTAKQRLRFETCRNCWSRLSFRRDWCHFLCAPPVFLCWMPPTVISVLVKVPLKGSRLLLLQASLQWRPATADPCSSVRALN